MSNDKIVEVRSKVIMKSKDFSEEVVGLQSEGYVTLKIDHENNYFMNLSIL